MIECPCKLHSQRNNYPKQWLNCGSKAEPGKPRIVIYFASTKYDPAMLGKQMKDAFPDSILVGCSTAGEITSGKMLSGSVVAMFLGPEVVEDAAVAVIEDLMLRSCRKKGLRGL